MPTCGSSHLGCTRRCNPLEVIALFGDRESVDIGHPIARTFRALTGFDSPSGMHYNMYVLITCSTGVGCNRWAAR